MKIRIEPENRAALYEALDKAYTSRDHQLHRSPERVNSQDILDLAERALNRMPELLVVERVGAKASYLPGLDGGGYQIPGDGWDLRVQIEHFATGWFLTKLEPFDFFDWVRTGGAAQGGHTVVFLEKHAYDLIKDRRMEGLLRVVEPENTKGKAE